MGCAAAETMTAASVAVPAPPSQRGAKNALHRVGVRRNGVFDGVPVVGAELACEKQFGELVIEVLDKREDHSRELRRIGCGEHPVAHTVVDDARQRR